MNGAEWHSQDPYRCRFDWGWRGASAAAARGDIVVIADVLRFSSAVATAVHHGASVHPAHFATEDGGGIARASGAELAGGEGARFSLSPRTFISAEHGARVVLPSPNGAECSVRAKGAAAVIAAALLNAGAVAATVTRALSSSERNVTVIACGERWHDGHDDGALRPAVEDYLGAGAVLLDIPHEKSPEAIVCADAFLRAQNDLGELLWDCASGRELRDKGLAADVHDCARLNLYDSVPVLRDGWYVRLGK